MRKRAALASLIALLLVLPATSASAQTYAVIHTFTGGLDGFWPYAGVTVDAAGNLYGTTTEYDAGSVYQMKRRNGNWIFATLCDSGYCGPIPQGRPVIGPGGALYGTALEGGQGDCSEFGCGLVYSLRPPQTICRSVSCSWSSQLTWGFDGNDGYQPGFVDPAFDSAGNMYGTTSQGGPNYYGNVFELTRSNGQWTGTSIHDFNQTDGWYPYSGVTLDSLGNVYGTTWVGGPSNNGTVYRLTYSGSGWTLATLYSFPNSADGSNPLGQVVFDAAGNLYGACQSGGSGGGGTVFELSPSGGDWTYHVLYSFTGNGDGPIGTVLLDAAGNLYGTTHGEGAYGFGSIFKLTRTNGQWTYTDLHDFTGGDDGANPVGGVSTDANGNLYGTTTYGGTQQGSFCQQQGCGVVWEIVP